MGFLREGVGMTFIEILLLVGPLAVVLGICAGLFFSPDSWKRKPNRIEKLSTQEIINLAKNDDDMQVIRGSIRELSGRGESLDFIKPRILDMSASANTVVRMTGSELLRDFFDVPANPQSPTKHRPSLTGA